MSKIEITRKSNHLCKDGSKEVDFEKVAFHVNKLHYKVDRNLDAFKARTGHQHHLRKKTTSSPLSFLKKFKSSSKATTGAGTGSDPLTDESEELWHGPITLGGQTIQVDFDTGSSDIILNNSAYKPGATATDTKNTFSTAYGDGTTASGKVYLDTLEIAGLSANNCAIGLASTNYLSTSENDSGIAGMAYPSLAQLKQPPFFDTLMNAGVLQQNVFTFTLSDTGSALYLGGIPDSVTDPIYAPVDSSQGFWGVTGSINGTSTAAILDTGTTLIVCPVAYATALFKKLGLKTTTESGSIYAMYDSANPPSITVTVGSFSQVLSSATMSLGTQDGQEVLSIIGSDVGINACIFGDR
jgi:predicted aspartyl protease